MDHACLHRTLINDGAKPRLSIDMATIINSKYSHSRDEGFDPRAYRYYDAKDINSIGKTHRYVVDESLSSSSTTIKIKSI